MPGRRRRRGAARESEPSREVAVAGAAANMAGLFHFEHASADLVTLDRLEQGLEVAFAESIVALALDEFEEHRPENGLRKNLQQQPRLAVLCAAVKKNPALLQFGHRLAVAGEAVF